MPGSGHSAIASGARSARAAVELTVALGSVIRSRTRAPIPPQFDGRIGATLLATLALWWSAGTGPTIVVLAVIWVLPSIRRRRAIRRESDLIRDALPDAIDMFRLAVAAGCSVHQLLDVVGPQLEPPISTAVTRTRDRIALGVRLGDALDALDARHDLLRPLATALRAAAFDGVPLGPALERLSVDSRLHRRRKAEERARALPVRLLFPLVVCVLPAFGLLAVVPVLVALLPSMGI